MDSFEKDVLFELAKFLSFREILAIATTNIELQKKILDPEFNKSLVIELGFPFGLSFNELKVYEGMDLNERLLAACKIQDMRLVKKLIELGAPSDECMVRASKLGYIEIAKYTIEQGATDFVEAIALAIMYNRLEIVKFLFDLVENFNEIDPEELGIFEAAEQGNKEVIEFLISKGYEKHNNSILNSAAYGGQLELVKFMVNLGTPISNISIENSIIDGDLNLVKYFVEQGKNDFNFILDVSTKNKNIEIMKYAIAQGANNVNDVLWNTVNDSIKIKEVLNLLIRYATDQDAINAAQKEL